MFVCLFVCLYVCSITYKRMIPKSSNLVQEMILGCTKCNGFEVERSKVKVIGSIRAFLE